MFTLKLLKREKNAAVPLFHACQHFFFYLKRHKIIIYETFLKESTVLTAISRTGLHTLKLENNPVMFLDMFWLGLCLTLVIGPGGRWDGGDTCKNRVHWQDMSQTLVVCENHNIHRTGRAKGLNPVTQGSSERSCMTRK